MRILMTAAYIYDDRWNEFTKNKTGFGMMVNTIFQAMSEEKEVYLISHVLTKGHEEKILRHTLVDVLSNSKWRDWRQGIKWFIKYKQPIKNRIKYIYYCVNKGFIRTTIQRLHPDIVHIHGIGYTSKTYIEICEEMHVPYIVTLHGIIGLNEMVSAPEWDKQYEHDFLVDADKRNIPVTVISTGIKQRIEKYYLGHAANNVSVILNGTKIPFRFEEKNKEWNLREKFNLADSVKICIATGSVCERKNQIQIIEAFSLMPQEKRKNIVLFVCGTDRLNGELEKRMQLYNLEENIHCLGFIQQDVLGVLLEQADLNIAASLDEGFGLSIIEGYSHGVPTLTFGDLDAVMDLYHEKAMVLCTSRDTKEFAESIISALNCIWDRTYIREYARTFSLKKIADTCEEEYRQALAEGGYLALTKTYDYIRINQLLGKKIVVCVGNITKNKNQMQAVRCISHIKNECLLIVLGNEADGGVLRQYICAHKLHKNVVLAGFCDDLDEVWKSADLNVFVSLNDGFGLSIIEGYLRGVPCVTFEDLDAVSDVYCEGLMIKLNIRDDETLINGINRALNCEWDAEQIMKIAKKFGIHNMTDSYYNFYGKIAGEKAS